MPAREPLEPNFEGGRGYLVKGSLLNALIRAVLRTPVAGDGLEEIATPSGVVWRATATGSEATAGAFFRVFQDSGDWMLQGGQVMGGAGNEVLGAITLATVGSEPADGTNHWLEITGDGVTDSGILLAGFDITAATDGSGSAMPANTLPTASTATGRKVYVLLGTWEDEVFSPSQSGNVGVTFCPGGYTISRGS